MPDRIGIIVNGATGRMENQHLINYHYMLEQIVAPVAAAANRPRIPNSRLLSGPHGIIASRRAVESFSI
jgi:hypothetical protein